MGVAQKEEAGLLLLPSLPKEGVLMEEGRGGTRHWDQRKQKKTVTITSLHENDPFRTYTRQLEISGFLFEG